MPPSRFSPKSDGEFGSEKSLKVVLIVFFLPNFQFSDGAFRSDKIIHGRANRILRRIFHFQTNGEFFGRKEFYGRAMISICSAGY